VFVDGAVTTFSGRLFHCGTTRWLKKNFLTFNLDLLTEIFILCPLRLCALSDSSKNLLFSMFSFPVSILYVSVRSPLFLRLSSMVSPRRFSLSPFRLASTQCAGPALRCILWLRYGATERPISSRKRCAHYMLCPLAKMTDNVVSTHRLSIISNSIIKTIKINTQIYLRHLEYWTST